MLRQLLRIRVTCYQSNLERGQVLPPERKIKTVSTNLKTVPISAADLMCYTAPCQPRVTPEPHVPYR